MSAWNHAVCDPCWMLIEPFRAPVRMREPYRRDTLCCWCGDETRSGIYRRAKPGSLSCQPGRGEHVNDD